MQLDRMIASLKSFGETLPQLVSNVSAENAKWKPPSQNWSILEIVCHLVDEEVEDFRRRVQMTLEDPSQEWASINPEIWAVERKYNEQNLQEKVQAFVAERTKSIDWLEGLSGADWNKAYQHKHFGPMRAGDLLVAWTAHDQLHVRQIAKRKFELVRRDAGDYVADYAGDWNEA